MEIFPAVDVLRGMCVQLVQGERSTATVYGTPIENAKKWIGLGARNLHVVNLDGAFSASSENVRVIREVVADTDAFVQVGGGIRSIVDACVWLDAGADRIMAGVDARAGVRLWCPDGRRRQADYIEWAQLFEQLGAGSLFVHQCGCGRPAGRYFCRIC